jgi:general secretion pathway protein J
VKRSKGFSLIEILVAVAILSVVSVMAFTGLRAMLTARDQTTHVAAELTALQNAISTIERDFEQAANRPIRDQYGDSEAALRTSEENEIIFTRGGYPNPANIRRSALLRVSYHFEEGVLYRSTWSVLDGARENQKRTRPLLSNLESFHFRFLDQGDKWSKEWPPERPHERKEQVDLDLLPRALELELELTEDEKMTFLFRIPGINETVRKLILIDGGER